MEEVDKKQAKMVSTVLAVLGIILILAGPAFHLIANTPALFAGIVCFVIAAAVSGLAKKEGGEKKAEKGEKEEETDEKE
ncbi:hypothetical protein A2164_03105 [Candidatus Curtissbacteria bacterium RBG_13_35_7]|uniref:Uncharacterized protein n=1 Tax=Candidatus Curtissbacteria bacterium RBG_13_35_7 TaxID=1797705 RepID=A0A1F5G1B0_9BACT|nr:MAG: hypothetical protein A2164_03105 [Candidatus Curtissbacteria bacterium RBG_13_35_7]